MSSPPHQASDDYVRSPLPFACDYLETLLDALLRDFDSREYRPSWWPRQLFKELCASRDLRRVIRNRHVPNTLPVGYFPPTDADDAIKDEASWRIASELKSLYETISEDELQPHGPAGDPPLVQLPAHREQVDLAVSGLPTPTVRAALPARDWEWRLRDLLYGGRCSWTFFCGFSHNGSHPRWYRRSFAIWVGGSGENSRFATIPPAMVGRPSGRCIHRQRFKPRLPMTWMRSFVT